ncbi:MAG: hypothetical protein OJJ21_04620 [Ferrovibrio sp.]|uniref:hypothetical protein n=1 Tax=Ferrovibrio sp. TaxID=1917215 RepID=UPI0026268148|nr:hypothetical protein [Ferrovibrio sp.]MCW0232863.1 hypothetical protein [Ferrovibrio sp.]
MGKFAVATVAVLATAAVFVTFALPEIVGSNRAVEPTPEKAAALPASPPKPAETSTPENKKAEAEKVLADTLRQLARIEGEGARTWGIEPVDGASIAAVDALLERARTLFAQRNYAAASTVLTETAASIKRLDETKPGRLDVAVQAGAKALAALDAPTAEKHYRVAASLKPGAPEIETALERAKKLPEALRHLNAGSAAEQAGSSEEALQAYQSALAVDPALTGAKEGLKRVEAAAKAANLRKAVSKVHERLNAHDAFGAESALAQAAKIEPGAPEIADLRRRVVAAVQVARIEKVRARAEDSEKKENWSEALRAYEEALAIDPNAAFASTGRARARAQVDLHRNIDSYLDQPSRLQSASPLAHATAILAATSKQVEGPVLAAKKEKLQKLVYAYSRPVPVVIKSDRQTSVELYRVGLIGLFETYRMELPPGKYVAVGSRTGYRDVRVEFEVPPGATEHNVSIKCTEAIR